MPQTCNLEDQCIPFVWVITFNLSSKGDPTSSYVTPGIAIQIIWPHMPHHYGKAEIQMGKQLYKFIITFNCVTRQMLYFFSVACCSHLWTVMFATLLSIMFHSHNAKKKGGGEERKKNTHNINKYQFKELFSSYVATICVSISFKVTKIWDGGLPFWLVSLEVCILYFNLLWSYICKFVIICVYLFNLKFCSKFVPLY